MSTHALHDLMARAETLSSDEKLRLAIHLLEQMRRGTSRSDYRWSDIRGLFPDLLEGEDAQDWVTRNRKESTDHRDAMLRQ